MAWRSMIPNQTPTRFIKDACVGVKWQWTRGFASSQALPEGHASGTDQRHLPPDLHWVCGRWVVVFALLMTGQEVQDNGIGEVVGRWG